MPTVELSTLHAKRRCFLWDGTEIQVVRQSPGSTLVRYLESGARVPISHRTQVYLSKPPRHPMLGPEPSIG